MADDDDNGKRKPLKVASAGSLILLQLFSRLITLFMTQMQVRLTSAEVLGAANIHFELILGLILTLSREGFRTALSRSVVSKSTKNVALLPIPIGIVISGIVMSVYTTYLAPIELVRHPHFHWATMTFLVGAVLELLAEPLYIDALVRLDTFTRVKAEGIAITAKSAAILGTLVLMQDTTTLLPFGIGQMIFGGAFLAVFWTSYANRSGLYESLRYLWPSRGNEKTLLNREALWLSFTMTRQNLVKHGLGEGDKFAVVRLASLSDQGAYALASNYGECNESLS
jgi:oligosaccharide translocation protein RFT1